jgi:hypothetical protein
MATAKRRGVPTPASAARKAATKSQAAINARAARKANNSAIHKAALASVKDEAMALIAVPPDPDPDLKRMHYEEMTEEQLAWFLREVTKGAAVKLMPGRRSDFPSEYELWKGIGDETSRLSKLYAQGKQLAVARIEEQIAEVSSTPQFGEIVIQRQVPTKFGIEDTVEVRKVEMLGHRTLLVDTLKWQLAHIRPKKHGRQPDVGGDGSNDQLKALFGALMSGPAKE